MVHPFQFTPFSSGQRNCIGQHLAKLESRLILAKLFKKYDIEVEHPEKIKFVRKLLAYPDNFYAKLIPRKV